MGAPTRRALKETQVPSAGNRSCRTLAYRKQPNLLTPGDATARLRKVGTTRHVMDEASAAQTIEQHSAPPQRLSLQAIQFQVFCSPWD
jgi:hypothetical protein